MAELLSNEQITEYLREVAQILGDEGEPKVVIVVGGALLAHYGLRDSTHDVDSVKQIDQELKTAALQVAERHDLAPTWLNPRAAAFRPSTLRNEDCEVWLEEGRLVVLAAPIQQVFLMKVHAGRSADYPDLVKAWSSTGFESAVQALDAYNVAYPSDFEDEGLLGFLEEVARKSESTRSH